MEFYFNYCPKIEILEHPLSHSFGTFISSGYSRSLVVSIDGVGDNISTLITKFEKKNNKIN